MSSISAMLIDEEEQKIKDKRTCDLDFTGCSHVNVKLVYAVAF